MPYRLRNQGNRFCVYNVNTEKTVPGGCHASKEDAVAHLQALNINVHDLPVKKKNESSSSKSKGSSKRESSASVGKRVWRGR